VVLPPEPPVLEFPPVLELPPDVPVEPPDPEEPPPTGEEKIELGMLVYGWLRHIRDEIDEVINEIDLHVPEWRLQAAQERAESRSQSMVGDPPGRTPRRGVR
jgi:hypothetical protein